MYKDNNKIKRMLSTLDCWYGFVSWIENNPATLDAMKHTSSGRYEKDIDKYISYGIIKVINVNKNGEDLYGLTNFGKDLAIHGDKY